MMWNQTVWRQNDQSLKIFFFEIFRFYHTNLYIFISWSSELNLSTFRFTNENCSRWKSTQCFWKKFYRRSLLKKRIRNSKIMLIYFEFRTLFDLRNKETSTIKRCFRYLNKTMKIKFELRMLLHLCLKKKYNLEIIETFLYFWKRTESRNLLRCYCIFWTINC
jgi:hypothetical protein